MSNLKARQIVIGYLIENFGYNLEFATNWISSSNPNFEMTSPEELIKAGRVDKIMLFLIATKDGY